MQHYATGPWTHSCTCALRNRPTNIHPWEKRKGEVLRLNKTPKANPKLEGVPLGYEPCGKGEGLCPCAVA